MKNNIKNKFIELVGAKGSFRRNSMIMSSGAMVNIFIAFFLTPIVTRIYSKEEFGVFYIYMSIVAITSLVISGMYPHALVVPKFRSDFLALLKLCILTGLAGTTLFFVILFFAGSTLLPLAGANKLVEYWFLLPIGMFLTTLNVIFVNWNVRRKEFKKNVSSNVVKSISSKGYQIGYGTSFLAVFPGLIYSDIVSKSIGILLLWSKDMTIDLKLMSKIDKSEILRIGKEYIKYPTYLLGSNFVNRFTSDIPLYLLSSFYGAGAVGAFGFANMMLNIPFNVIGNSIAPVYFQRANELYLTDKDKLKSFTLKSYDKMLLLGCLAFGFIFAFGDVVFSFIFSAEWELAGNMARILSIYYVFKLISSPFARVLRVVGKEQLTLNYSIVLAVLRIGSFVSLYIFDSIFYVLIIFSISNLIGYLYVNYLVFRSLDIGYRQISTGVINYAVPIFFVFSFLRLIVNNYL